MKVIMVEGESPAAIEAEVKAHELDGPDVLIIEVVKVMPRPGQADPEKTLQDPAKLPVDDQAAQLRAEIDDPGAVQEVGSKDK